MSAGERPSLAGWLLSVAVALPILLFIVVPVGAMLASSFKVTAPMSAKVLLDATDAALARLDGGLEARLADWWAKADDRARAETLAAGFEIVEGEVPWDDKATFDHQLDAAAVALDRLDDAIRSELETLLPRIHASRFKRAVIAAQLHDHMKAGDLASFRAGETWQIGLDNYTAPFHEAKLQRAALASLGLGFTSASLVTLIAFLLSYAVHRRVLPGAGALQGILLAPLVSPPVILALAMLLLFGRQGLITKTALDDGLGLIDATTTNIYGLGGVLVAQLLGFIGPAFILVSSVLTRHDPELDDAASSLGASWTQCFLQVTLPMAWPGIARAFLLVFVLSMTDFGNPLVIGQNLPVLAAEIYGLIIASRDYPLAAALCVWLILPAALLAGLVELLGRRRRFAGRQRPDQPERRPVPFPILASLAALATLVGGLIIALFATVIASAFIVQWGVDYNPTILHFLGERPDRAFEGTGFGTSGLGVGPVLDSLRVALIAAPIGGLLAVGLAYVQERIRPPGAAALGVIAMLPAILPGLIFGIGYLVAFNNPLGRPELALTGSLGILVINILFGNLFVGVLAARAALQQASPAVEEAAESLGAGQLRRLLTVVLPAIWPAFLLGVLYIFVDGMTTFSSVIFLVSGRWELASVEIFNQAGGTDYGAAAAKTTVILLIVAALLVIMRQLQYRRSSG